MKKWRPGAGGKKGATESYCNLEKGDNKQFVNYTPIGKCSARTIIYMIGKKIVFSFDMVNYPSPPGNVMEYGKEGNNNSRSIKREEALEGRIKLWKIYWECIGEIIHPLF